MSYYLKKVVNQGNGTAQVNGTPITIGGNKTFSNLKIAGVRILYANVDWELFTVTEGFNVELKVKDVNETRGTYTLLDNIKWDDIEIDVNDDTGSNCPFYAKGA